MFRPPLLIACGLLAGVLPSLASAQWEVPMGQTPFGPHVRWTTLGEGLDSEIKTAEWRVLGNEMEWRNHFSRMLGRPLQANEQIPAGADWNRQLLVAIHAGPKLGNGWRVYVETIGRSAPGFWDIQV
ncbi:MAG: hypothetical protein MH204_03105, partial [Fimbriimonadaceae bacterium]|nr:hypothetical protein [Fimbriimonadaceae bacterium]